MGHNCYFFFLLCKMLRIDPCWFFYRPPKCSMDDFPDWICCHEYRLRSSGNQCDDGGDSNPHPPWIAHDTKSSIINHQSSSREKESQLATRFFYGGSQNTTRQTRILYSDLLPQYFVVLPVFQIFRRITLQTSC